MNEQMNGWLNEKQDRNWSQEECVPQT